VASDRVTVNKNKTTRPSYRGEPNIQLLHRDRVFSLGVKRGPVEQMTAHTAMTGLFERYADTFVAFCVSIVVRRDKG
jgi:hypothetical protein